MKQDPLSERLEIAKRNVMVLMIQEGIFDLFTWILIGLAIFWKQRLGIIAFFAWICSMAWYHKRRQAMDRVIGLSLEKDNIEKMVRYAKAKTKVKKQQ